MSKIKILVVIGTRPEAIKMSPVILALKKNSYIDCVVCVTGQHNEMLHQVLNIFEIQPDYDLNIMKSSQTLNYVASSILNTLKPVLEKENPNLVLVHGDTTTTFAAALSSFYEKIPVGHVEAGLRTDNIYNPFPEEMNRMLVTNLSSINFAPTQLSKSNLIKENINSETIYITGNTAIDVIKTTLSSDYIFNYKPLNEIDFKGKRIITVTSHRRENLGNSLVNICSAINKISDKYDDVEFMYSLHPNPLVQNTVIPLLENNKKVHIINSLDIKDMHNLISKSYTILTDSGGIQEEAPSMGTPVLVLRDETERPEGVDVGVLKVVGTSSDGIFTSTCKILDDKDEYNSMILNKNPYGDGNASSRIVNAILHYFNIRDQRPEDYK